MSQWNVFDEISAASAKELGHYILYKDRWIANRHAQQNTTTYARGDIVNVELGAGNFRSEPSFAHPCVVLAGTRDFIWIVPGSTKSYGRNYRDVIDATQQDGFTLNTGLQMYATKWVNKNRVMGRINRVSDRVLNEIDENLLHRIPRHHRIKSQLNGQIAHLQTDRQQAIDHAQQLQQQVSELQGKLNEAQAKVNVSLSVLSVLRELDPDIIQRIHEELRKKGHEPDTLTGA